MIWGYPYFWKHPFAAKGWNSFVETLEVSGMKNIANGGRLRRGMATVKRSASAKVGVPKNPSRNEIGTTYHGNPSYPPPQSYAPKK